MQRLQASIEEVSGLFSESIAAVQGALENENEADAELYSAQCQIEKLQHEVRSATEKNRILEDKLREKKQLPFSAVSTQHPPRYVGLDYPMFSEMMYLNVKSTPCSVLNAVE